MAVNGRPLPGEIHDDIKVDMFLFLSGIGLWFSWTKNEESLNFSLSHFLNFYYRRFLRRFGRACSRAIESATIYMEYNYHGEEPPLTAEEMHRLHVKPDDKVIVWGDCRG